MNNKKAALILAGCIGLTSVGSLSAYADTDTAQYGSWQEAYMALLLDFKNSKSYYSPEVHEDSLSSMFDLSDITGDGIPELIISEGGYHPSEVKIFSYAGGDAYEMLQAGYWGQLYYNTDPSHDGVYIAEQDTSQEVSIFNIFVCNNGGASPVALFKKNAGGNGLDPVYFVDNHEVTADEYDTALSKYKNLKFSPTQRRYSLEPLTKNTDLSTYFSSEPVLLGDVTLDGIIDGIDASSILTAYAKSSVEGGDTGYNEVQKYAADVNSDNIIDGIDATMVLTYYAKTSVGYIGTFEDYKAGKVFSGDNFMAGLESDDDAKQFLDGTWYMLPGGQPSVLEPPFKMFADRNTSTFSIIETNSENALSSGFDVLDLFATPRGCCDLIRATPPGTIKTDGMTDSEIIDYSFDLHFTAAYVNGVPVIAMAPIGNGISPVDALVKGEHMTNSYNWVFVRDTDGDITGIDDAKMNELRNKDTTFYAYRWLDMGSEVYLQEVNTTITDIMFEDGSTKDAMYYSYKDNGHALTAVRYPVKGAEKLANSGDYRPALVKVTTDKDGNVTELAEMQQIGYGYYNLK